MITGAPLQLAIVGVGRMGAFHARKLATLDAISIVGVADVSEELAVALADELGGIATYSSPDALLGAPEVEAWLIATPTTTHPEVVQKALDNGLHVLCEKPLALDPEAGAELSAMARAKGLVLQVGFWRRFSRPWVRAKELLERGAVGRPLLVRLAQWDANPPPPEFCDPEVSGGLAIDCGIHEFDLVEWLTGLSIRRVDARRLPVVDARLEEVGDVDNLLAVLDLDGGAVAIVDLSRNARYGDDVRTEVLGSEGALFVDLLPEGRTRLGDADGLRVVDGSETPDAMASGVVGQAEAFAAAIRGGTIDFPDGAASNRAVTVGRAVQESTRSGVSVDLAGPQRIANLAESDQPDPLTG